MKKDVLLPDLIKDILIIIKLRNGLRNVFLVTKLLKAIHSRYL